MSAARWGAVTVAALLAAATRWPNPSLWQWAGLAGALAIAVCGGLALQRPTPRRRALGVVACAAGLLLPPSTSALLLLHPIVAALVTLAAILAIASTEQRPATGPAPKGLGGGGWMRTGAWLAVPPLLMGALALVGPQRLAHLAERDLAIPVLAALLLLAAAAAIHCARAGRSEA